MRAERTFDHTALVEKYQPHWVWGVAFVAVPFFLILVAFAGLMVGSPVPLAVAATTPRVALGIAIGGMAAAFIRRRKVPMQIAALGVMMSATGYLFLWWLSR